MLQITPNNKSISERDKAKIRGELDREFIEARIINEGYLSLDEIEKGYIREIIAKENMIEKKELTDTEVLDFCKDIKALYFKELCEQKIIVGFTASNGHYYRTNRDDQTNMIGQKDELNANPNIATVFWKSEDAGYLSHTREEWLQVYAQAFTHKKSQLFMYDSLKQQVFNSTTHEELSQIQWV